MIVRVSSSSLARKSIGILGHWKSLSVSQRRAIVALGCETLKAVAFQVKPIQRKQTRTPFFELFFALQTPFQELFPTSARVNLDIVDKLRAVHVEHPASHLLREESRFKGEALLLHLPRSELGSGHAVDKLMSWSYWEKLGEAGRSE